MNDLHAFNSSECALHFDWLPRALGRCCNFGLRRDAGLLQYCILGNEEMPRGF